MLNAWLILIGCFVFLFAFPIPGFVPVLFVQVNCVSFFLLYVFANSISVGICCAYSRKSVLAYQRRPRLVRRFRFCTPLFWLSAHFTIVFACTFRKWNLWSQILGRRSKSTISLIFCVICWRISTCSCQPTRRHIHTCSQTVCLLLAGDTFVMGCSGLFFAHFLGLRRGCET